VGFVYSSILHGFYILLRSPAFCRDVTVLVLECEWNILVWYMFGGMLTCLKLCYIINIRIFRLGTQLVYEMFDPRECIGKVGSVMIRG